MLLHEGEDANIFGRKACKLGTDGSMSFEVSTGKNKHKFVAEDVVIRTDVRGVITYWNRSVAELTGFTSKEAKGQRLSYFLVPPGSKDEKVLDARQIAAGKSFAGRVNLRRKGGGEVSVFLYAAERRRGKGKAVGMECIGREAPDDLLTEDVLRSIEERYATLVRTTSEVVVAIDGRGQIVDANPAAARLAGIPTEKLLGRSVLEFVPVKKRAEAERLFREVRRQSRMQTTLEFCFPVRIANGEQRAEAAERHVFLEFSVTPLVFQGKRLYYAVGRDVTERLAQERALRESIEKLQSIFAAVNGGLFLETLEGEILEVNEGACQLLGYTREELVGKNAADLVPASAQTFLAHVRNLLLKEGEFRVEGVNLRKDGTEVPVDVSGSLVQMGDQTLALVLVQDATERIAAEQALRESEANFHALADNALDGILIAAGPDAKHVYANRRAAEITGYTVEELGEIGMRGLAHPDELPQISLRYQQRLQGKPVPPQYETRIVAKDGRVVPIELTAARTLWHNQPADLVIIRDVTARKQAEQELAESHARMARLLANLPGMAYRRRWEEGWPLEFVSEGCVELTGLQPEELIGKDNITFNIMIHPLDRCLAEAEIKASLESHLPFQLVYRLRTKAGEKWVWEQGRGVYDQEGRLVAFEGFITDITSRIHAEEALRTSEQLYREALDAMWTSVHVVDRDLRIILANRALKEWVEKHGIDPRLEGKTVFEAFPFLPGKVREEYERVFSTGQRVFTQEETTVAGEVRITETRKLPIFSGGQVVRVMTMIRDITESKLAEKRLRESEESFRSLAENAFDGIAVYGADERFLYVNKRMAEMFGYTVEQMEQMTFNDTARPEDRPQHTERARKRLSGELLPNRYETVAVRSNGVQFPVELSVTRASWRGQTAGIVFVRDLSPLREAEKAQRQMEGLFRTLFELTPDAVGLHQDGKIVAVNQAAARLLGYNSPEELVGKPALELVHPDDRKRIEERIRQTLAGRASELLELRVLRRDGTAVWVSGNDGRIFWQGRPAILVSLRDETERMQKNRMLQEAEERYRLLFELSPDGIAVHQDGRVVLVNPAGLRMLGYERPEELVGKPVLEVVHPDFRSMVVERIRQTMETGFSVPLFEELFLRRDGTPIWVEVASSRIVWQGRPAVLVVARAIPGRKEPRAKLG